MDSQKESQSLPSRRGRQIPPIQTQLTSEALRSHRPRPAKDHTSVHPAERVPLQPAVKRHSSIKGFTTLFKSARASDKNQNLAVVEESQGAANCTTPVSAPLHSANTHATSKPETPKPAPAAAAAPVTQTPKDKTPKNLSKRPKEKPPRTITSWDPPPLFKAYPQSVKHVSLLAPKLPSDTILRLNGRRSSSATDESLPEGDDVDGNENKKQKKRDKKDSRRLSVSINKTEWSQKIFVLVTSGYLLQYTGDGHFDRLPEKMMQLNKDSVAFASDAIPGKHWVVQVSQALDDDTVAPEKPKGLFSRLGFQSSGARRATKSFLLVLENPADMNSWLVVLRREIEALGGSKYAPETPLGEKPGQQLQNKPSLKYLKKRDSMRTLNPQAEADAKGATVAAKPVKQDNKQQGQKTVGDAPSVKSMKRQSMPTRPSVEAPSLSTLATTTDLDRLRESSRFSYVSAGTRTISSSRGSSPGDSPSGSNFPVSRRPNLDPCAAFRGTAATSVTSSPMGRQPLKSRSQVPLERNPEEPQSTPSSQLTSSPPVSRNGSPAPNFSVPSFSKRFSLPSTSPNLAPPSPDPMSRSQQASPIPGQPSSRGTDGSLTSGSDIIRENVETPRSNPLSSDGDVSLPTSSDGTQYPTRTPSARSNSSASGRIRAKRAPSREHSMRNYRSSHPPLSTIALPELSPLADEFPGVGSTRSRRGSFPHQNTKNMKSSPKANRQSSRHSARIQARPEVSTQSSPVRSPPYADTSAINKARSGSLYFSPQSQPNTGSETENSTFDKTDSTRSQDAKRLSARKSLPEFSFGPPVAPPPDCPLPEVPPIVVSQFQSARHGSPSMAGTAPARSRRSTGGRKSFTSEPRVQPKYDDILYNLDDDSNSEGANALNVF